MNPGFVYFYQKCYMYVLHTFPAVSAVLCSAAYLYYLWKIYRYKYFIFKLRSFIDSTDTFSQVLKYRLYCQRRLVIFQELLSPAHSEKNNRYPWFRASTADFIWTDIIFKMSAGKIVNASKGLFLIWYLNLKPLFDLEYIPR